MEKIVEGRGVDIAGRALWISGDFWLMFSFNMLLSGTGLMYINNVGSISQALFAKGNPAYDEVEASVWQAAQVSIISIMNFSGRILIGITADFVKSRWRYPRSFCMTLVASLFILSQVIMMTTDDIHNLWRASALLGLAYGGLFGLLPTVCIEWFGLAHFSENWGYVTLSPVVGSNLFSLAFGRNLDSHDSPAASAPANSTILASTSTMPEFAARAGFTPERQCLDGRECYVASLYLTLAACVVALVLGIWAGRRDWKDGQDKERQVDEVVWEVTAAEE